MLHAKWKLTVSGFVLSMVLLLGTGCSSLTRFFQPQRPTTPSEIALFSGKILETSAKDYCKFQEKDGTIWNVWINADTTISGQSESSSELKKLLVSDIQPGSECHIKGYIKNPGNHQNKQEAGIIIATEIVLQWTESKKTVYSVFFNNTVKDPNLLDCSKVYPVERTADEDAIFEEILMLLFEGPTDEEKKQGYVTAIPDDIVINFIVRNNGKMHVDFKPFHIAGACATAAFAAQVTQTLLAIPGTKEVVISIMGQTEGILQP